MSQSQIILVIAIIITGPISFYSGLVNAWLFGNFFPGLNAETASSTTLFLWKAFNILLTWAIAAFLLKSLISFIWGFFAGK